jgi:hypothetical protein
MGFLDRFRSRHEPSSSKQAEALTTPVSVLGGEDTLEVVGESWHQDVLWRLSGRTRGERVRCDIIAILVPEPTNPYDANAISAQIDGEMVGYLPRAMAQQYLPGLKSVVSSRHAHVGLRGVIAGGGYRENGPGLLGVFLDHDPADFGVQPTLPPHPGPPRYSSAEGVMRTGFTEAWLTDTADNSYDLSWCNDLPEADRPAIAKLRELLAADSDPIDRHFQFAELETRLYRSRDLFQSALAEYDEACVRHDTEMESICDAFMAKWGEVPLLDTYRQMAIRQQKNKDWQACKWWAERGLILYGQRAAREEAVEDLVKRRNRAVAKLEAAATPRRQVRQEDPERTAVSQTSSREPGRTNSNAELELLVCQGCGRRFERMRVRGRKPMFCPQCRTAARE